ncbi:hypothetical protein [Novosphingobium lindaniclasticum]|uniref:hypothetical protein n=1 Tax=Novosphingobium lindaniclasticum TaxID=1329895 RepID=UPI001F460DF6|nr:hypothetical protein [Novosphingobium lindaniclasticum]
MHVNPAHDRSMLQSAREAVGASAPRAFSRGPWLPLLAELLKLAGSRVEFLRHAERPWSSAMFCGSRHTVALAFNDRQAIADGERLIEALPEHEFAIPGQLVADAAISAADHRAGPLPSLTLEIELLLLEEC